MTYLYFTIDCMVVSFQPRAILSFNIALAFYSFNLKVTVNVKILGNLLMIRSKLKMYFQVYDPCVFEITFFKSISIAQYPERSLREREVVPGAFIAWAEGSTRSVHCVRGRSLVRALLILCPRQHRKWQCSIFRSESQESFGWGLTNRGHLSHQTVTRQRAVRATSLSYMHCLHLQPVTSLYE